MIETTGKSCDDGSNQEVGTKLWQSVYINYDICTNLTPQDKLIIYCDKIDGIDWQTNVV